MSDEYQQMIDDLFQAMPPGGPDWTTEIHVTRAYYDRMRRSATPQIASGISVTAFGTPVVIDDSLSAEPGFKVVHGRRDTPSSLP